MAKIKYETEDKICFLLSTNSLKNPKKIFKYIEQAAKIKKKCILIPELYGKPELFKKLYDIEIDKSFNLNLKDIESISCLGANIVLKFLQKLRKESKIDYDLIMEEIYKLIEKEKYIFKVIPVLWIHDELFAADLEILKNKNSQKG